MEKIDSTKVELDLDDMKRFFRTPSLIWWIIIPVGLLLTFVAWIDPKSLDSPYLPVVGPFASYVGQEMPDFVKFIVLIATLLHIAEAIYAALTCLTNELMPWYTILWTIQTFILGFPSLHLLISGVKKEKK